MAEYKPAYPFTTPIDLLIPTYTAVKGVSKKTYATTGIRLNCSFRTYGGTEQTTNDVYVIHDTGIVETWFRPDIKSDCRIRLFATGQVYEIIGVPENINMRNQFVRFKVKAIEGGA